MQSKHQAKVSSIRNKRAENLNVEVTEVERVKNVLKEECERNSFGTTITFIQRFIQDVPENKIKKILESASWAKYEYGKWEYLEISKKIKDSKSNYNETISSSESIISNVDNQADKEKMIDFSNIPTLVYTKPISLSYFGETNDTLHSWTELYTVFFTLLYEDYNHILKVGMSFAKNNDGRIEFGDAKMKNNMKSPKSITATDGKTYFIETNLSANNIVGKIKFLLDLCLVDHENVVIQYKENKATIKGESKKSLAHHRNRNYDEFSNWLLQNGCASSTIRNYTSAIRFSEKYAKEHKFQYRTLITNNNDLCSRTATALFQNKEFIELNRHQHNRLSAAISKLLDFYGINIDFKAATTLPKSVESMPQKSQINTTLFKKVLEKKFVRGFRIGSPLDMKKFRRYYEEINGKDTKLSDADVEATLLSCGIRYADKIFTPVTMLPAEVRDKLFLFIRASFSEGKQAVYYEALFRAFSDSFLDYYIYDAQMLKAYIAFYNNGEFHLESQYLCKDPLTQANPQDEVKNYLITSGVPVECTEICETLSHIPQKKIMQILRMSSEFVNNGKSHYFHVNMVHFSVEEIDNIANLIEEGINDKLFLSGNDLIEMIRARYPFIIENNQFISTMGMRNTLKYHLKERFSFKGNIISGHNHAFSMADVFGNYAKSRTEFTIAELATLALEMNSSIYFEAVYDNSLRVSRDRFVSKDMAQFRIDETDRVIDRFCTGGYLAIGEVDNWGAFPDAGYPWNSYLLEHYVYTYSKKYHLFHACFNRDCCVGAIVKNESGIQTFDDLLATALARSDIPLTREQALAFLVKEGYLAHRMYSNIEKVLIQANTYRNRKGTK